MNKEQRIAALMANKHNPVKDQASLTAMTDAGLTALETHCTTAAEAETRAAAEKATVNEQIAALQANSTRSIADDDPRLSDSTRQMIAGYKASQAARKSELVGKLKTAQTVYTEAELNEMQLDQLERITRLAKIEVASTNVDYSGVGFPRQQEQPVVPSGVEAPTSLVDAIRANSAKK
jgi:IMP dehydrogenase/GMP reductase